METQKRVPETLLEAINYFADRQIALDFVVSLRWPGGVTCPHCQSKEVGFLKTRLIWKCRGCKKQFSAKVGTIFEDSPLGLDKWLPAMWLVANCKNGISSYEIGRSLGVTQKTAWFMLHRIRLAMQTRTFEQMGGDVEIDETFIGGRAKYMHRSRRLRTLNHKTGWSGKAIVMGLLERNTEKGKSRVKVRMVQNTKRRSLFAEIKDGIAPGSNVYTDKLRSYEGLGREYVHGVIDHAERYVDGKIHTNGLENFWGLLKRSIRGTYISVEPFHLFRYLDEQAFRFNQRKDTDAGRFVRALSAIVGRRLTYRNLTQSAMATTC